MAALENGAWKLKVRDHSGGMFERYLAVDEENDRLAWFWLVTEGADSRRSVLARLETAYGSWMRAGPPWLRVRAVLTGDAGTGLLTEYTQGVRFDDLISAVGEPMPLPAAAWLALGVANALKTSPQTPTREEVPHFCPQSLLVGFDATPCLTPWPDLLPPSGEVHLPRRVDYFLPELVKWSDPLPGWRTWAPSVVLLHALEGVAPFRGESVLDTAHRVVTGTLVRPKVLERVPPPLRPLIAGAIAEWPAGRPDLGQLIAQLTPLADKAWLEDAVARHFPHERSEQAFERTLALGKDPEPLPPELVRAVAADATDESFGVLADWMLSQGRPRGELAAIQRRLARGADLELQRAEAQFMVRHRSVLPHSLRDRLAQWKPIWQAGWIVGLELRAVPSAPELEEILTHPTLRFLKRLRVAENAGHSRVLADVLSTLELPALRRVELDGAMVTHGARLKAARPHLEVARTEDRAGFPPRRRPEKAEPNARVGLDGREPAQGIGFLDRVWDWLNRGD